MGSLAGGGSVVRGAHDGGHMESTEGLLQGTE